MALATTLNPHTVVLLGAGALLAGLIPASVEAKPRQPAPVVFSPASGQPAAAPAQLTQSVGVKRLSFRYPDQPDREYGYGESEARPVGPAQDSAAIDLRGKLTPPAGASRAFDPRAAVAAVQPVADPVETAPVEAEPPQAVPAPPPTPAPVAPAQRPYWLEKERVGAPYQVNGRWYAPAAEPGYAETGKASWYGDEFHGKPTANGETFDKTALSAAHPTLPIPSLVQVTNLENGREVIVRVNDRGPFVQGRLIDVSHAAADVLGFTANGSARVHVRYLGPAPKRVAANATAPVRAAPAPRPLAQTAPRRPIVAPERAPVREAVVRRGEAGFMVQIGAFASAANANRVRQRAASVGDVTIDALPTPAGGEVFRVRVGPWRDRAAAEAAWESIQAQGLSGAIVAASAP
jgi:rare lipoprotein A